MDDGTSINPIGLFVTQASCAHAGAIATSANRDGSATEANHVVLLEFKGRHVLDNFQLSEPAGMRLAIPMCAVMTVINQLATAATEIEDQLDEDCR